MGKRQRSEANDENDGNLAGKRSSRRPFSHLKSPAMTVSSQSDNEVDIVWRHSPPPMNLKLCDTPGPNTRRRSDYSSKDIADMIECINSRNNSQQSPTISTPPLLGLWMQGRQDAETTPVAPKAGHRPPRRISSRKRPNDNWATLAKDLHMLAELSQTSRIPSTSHEDELEDGVDSEEDKENAVVTTLHRHGDDNANATFETSLQVDQEQEDEEVIVAVELPMEELWEDDSWFENEDVVQHATQVEEEAFSQKPCAEGNSAGSKTVKTDVHNKPSGSFIKSNASLIPLKDNCQKPLQSDNKSQFVLPPKVNRLSHKATFQASSTIGKSDRMGPSSSDKSSLKVSQVKQSQSRFQGHRSQFSKNVIPSSTSELSDGSLQTKSLSSSSNVSQFRKKPKESVSTAAGTEEHSSVTSAARSLQREDSNQCQISYSRVNSVTVSHVDHQTIDHNSSADLFDSSLTDDLLETTSGGDFENQTVENKSKTAGKSIPISPLRNDKLESDLFSDNSLLDEELLAAMEKEEMQWEEICSQQTEKVPTLNVSHCKQDGNVTNLQFKSVAKDTKCNDSKVAKSSALIGQPNGVLSKDQATGQMSSFSQFKAPSSSQFASSSKPASLIRSKESNSIVPQFRTHVTAGVGSFQRNEAKPNSKPSSHKQQSTMSTKPMLTAAVSSQAIKVPTGVFVSSQKSKDAKPGDNPSQSARSTFQFGRKQTGAAKPNIMSPLASHSKIRSDSESREGILDSLSNMKEIRPTVTANPPRTKQFTSKLPQVTKTLTAHHGTAGNTLNSSMLSQSSQFSSGSQVKTQEEINSDVTPSPVFSVNNHCSSSSHAKPPPNLGTKTTLPTSTEHGPSLNRNISSTKYVKVTTEGPEEPSGVNASIHGQSSQFVKVSGNELHKQTLTNRTHLVPPSREPRAKFFEPNSQTGTLQASRLDVQKADTTGAPCQRIPSQFSKARKVSPDQAQASVGGGKVPADGRKCSNDTNLISKVTNSSAKGNLTDSTKVSSTFSQFNSNSKKSEGSAIQNGTRLQNRYPPLDFKGISNGTTGNSQWNKPSASITKVKENEKTGNSQWNKPSASITKVKELNGEDQNGTTLVSQDLNRRTCSQEEIQRKRQEALARKKEKENIFGNHGMSLRNRTFSKKY
ncbi:uncharacterized protein [Apostichopus japonicus]|uniref:uncharacterized protein isoform X2 n=1 Tax=Stichopus japonicus TaxID=307972 RepID=UPI003AB16EDB